MSASERAYAYAKERILDGRFPGGELISEGDVAAPTGLSRTPVREAFLQLEAEGLLRLYPKRGALVVPVSAAEIEEVMEARRLIERFALAPAIERGAELEPQLAACLAEAERALQKGDAGAFVEADRRFHRVFLAAADNLILLEMIDSLRDRQHRMGVFAIAREADRMETILREHRALGEAVLAGDAERAEQLLDEHLDGTLRALRGGRLAAADSPG